ncbi:MAG: phosphatase [Elusimicrobia bacterium RIFOXYA2_FULL_39_19]|nr:MAG: phosphatase [Elusimicrobia bacterium RIFOXYA2_FULL_39_19]
MLEAVIFDMDGVLIDSEPFHLEVNKELFKQVGITFSEEEYTHFIGVSNKEMFAILKEKYKLTQSVEELSQMQLVGFLEYLEKEKHIQKPIPGVPELLADIKKAGLKTAVASSSDMRNIEAVLKILDIKKYFNALVSGVNVKKGKPAPDIFIETAKQLGVNPENCMVIEDAMHGVQAAKAAGMKCLGYVNHNSCNQDLTKADAVAEDFKKVNVLFLKSLF